MLSFYLVNLLLPGDPKEVKINSALGTWTLTKFIDYERSKTAIARGMAAHTYYLEHETASDVVFEEMTPLLLGATYATGTSVTVKSSTMSSTVQIMQPCERWPRDRAVESISPIFITEAEFVDLVEKFVSAWPERGQVEKALLLVHHWLDGLACWSMEDLYLSATTLLQVIVATEETRQAAGRLTFYQGVVDATARMGISTLSNDFKNMRNELVHSGQLIGTRFAGPSKEACAVVIAEVLNWFDEYMHVALALGARRKIRFDGDDFRNLNAYSIR